MGLDALVGMVTVVNRKRNCLVRGIGAVGVLLLMDRPARRQGQRTKGIGLAGA